LRKGLFRLFPVVAIFKMIPVEKLNVLHGNKVSQFTSSKFHKFYKAVYTVLMRLLDGKLVNFLLPSLH
jgi:hypothetical protein